MILAKLITAYFIGEFVLRTGRTRPVPSGKDPRSYYFYGVILVESLLGWLFLGSVSSWPLVVSFFGMRVAMDALLFFVSRHFLIRAPELLFYVVNLISIGIVTIFWKFGGQIEFPLKLTKALFVYGSALLFIAWGSVRWIQSFMNYWAKDINDNQDDSLENAGTFIGILERLFVFTFVVIGKWEAIGFLLAAKSIFRFGDLKESKDRKLTEYILIGTLLSFGIAIAVGLLVVYAMSQGV
jgi:hypothetical protein